jgi:hypothetical protein
MKFKKYLKSIVYLVFFPISLFLPLKEGLIIICNKIWKRVYDLFMFLSLFNDVSKIDFYHWEIFQRRRFKWGRKYSKSITKVGNLTAGQAQYQTGRLVGYEILKNKFYRIWIPFYVRLEFYSTPLVLLIQLVKNFLKRFFKLFLLEYSIYSMQLKKVLNLRKVAPGVFYFFYVLVFWLVFLFLWGFINIYLLPILAKLCSVIFTESEWIQIKGSFFLLTPFFSLILIYYSWSLTSWFFVKKKESEDLTDKFRNFDLFDEFDKDFLYKKLKEKKKTIYNKELNFLNQGGYRTSRYDRETMLDGMDSDGELGLKANMMASSKVDLVEIAKYISYSEKDKESYKAIFNKGRLYSDKYLKELEYIKKKNLEKLGSLSDYYLKKWLESGGRHIYKNDMKDINLDYDSDLMLEKAKKIIFDSYFEKFLGSSLEIDNESFFEDLKLTDEVLNFQKVPVDEEEDCNSWELFRHYLPRNDEDEDDVFLYTLEPEVNLVTITMDNAIVENETNIYNDRFYEEGELVDLFYSKSDENSKNTTEGYIDNYKDMLYLDWNRESMLAFDSVSPNRLAGDIKDVNSDAYRSWAPLDKLVKKVTGKKTKLEKLEINEYIELIPFLTKKIKRDYVKEVPEAWSKELRFAKRKKNHCSPLDLGLIDEDYIFLSKANIEETGLELEKFWQNKFKEKGYDFENVDVNLKETNFVRYDRVEAEYGVLETGLFILGPEILLLDEIYQRIESKIQESDSRKTLLEMEIAYLETEEYIPWSKLTWGMESWFDEPYYEYWLGRGFIEEDDPDVREHSDWEGEELGLQEDSSTELVEDRVDMDDVEIGDYFAIVAAVLSYIWIQSYSGITNMPNYYQEMGSKRSMPEIKYPLKVHDYIFGANKIYRKRRRLRFSRHYMRSVKKNQTLKQKDDHLFIGGYDEDSFFYIDSYDRDDLIQEMEYGNLTDITFWRTTGTAYSHQLESPKEGIYNIIDFSYTFWGTTLRVLSLFTMFFTGLFITMLDWSTSLLYFCFDWWIKQWWPFLATFGSGMFMIFLKEMGTYSVIGAEFLLQLGSVFNYLFTGQSLEWIQSSLWVILNSKSSLVLSISFKSTDWIPIYFNSMNFEFPFREIAWNKFDNFEIPTRIFLSHNLGIAISDFFVSILDFILKCSQFLVDIALSSLKMSCDFVPIWVNYLLVLSYLGQKVVFFILFFLFKLIVLFFYIIISIMLCII